MEQKIIDLHTEYLQGAMGRREFLKRLKIIVGGAATTTGLLLLLKKDDAKAQMVSKDDPRLYTEYIDYPGSTGKVRAVLARPKADAKRPAVLVIHENRGLNPHIEDVTRRLALEGFLAMGPDALSPLGGAPSDSDKARMMMRKLDKKSTLENYLAAVKYLKTHPLSTGKVGVVGFCWGGAVANQLAVNSPDVSAVIPFYGRQPAPEDVPKIQASLLLHYAEVDERINSGISAYENALKAAGIDYRMYIYDGTKHAFHNDTSAARYHKEAAELAWQRTISFFNEKLKH